MTQNQINRLNSIIEKIDTDISRTFRTKNSIGTELYGKYFLGNYEGKNFYLKLKFFVIFFLPIIPLSILLTYEYNLDTYIIGEIEENDLKKIIIDLKGLKKSAYLDGLYTGVFKFILLIITLFIAFGILYIFKYTMELI